MMIKKTAIVLAALLCGGFLFVRAGQESGGDKSLALKIGDPRFKDKLLDLAPDDLFSAETGKQLPFAEMIRNMKPAEIVYVGETHNSLPMHDLQLKIIQALYEQDRNLCLGLEMSPVTRQDVLSKWSLAILSREDFLRESQWYVDWNFNFGFYEKIFAFAKANKIPVYALNVPREIITRIRMSGWDGLTPEEKAIVPKPDLTNEEHRLLIRTILESSEIPHEMKGAGMDMMFEGLYRAQVAWDEVMAANAVEAVRKERKRMVVLAGSGHLIYNLGINMRAFQRSKLPFKTVICAVVTEGGKRIRVSRSLGDYIFGMAEEGKSVYPSVGLAFKKVGGLDNLVIESKPIDGVAEGSDFDKGDVVLSVDGRAFTDINELRIYLAKFKWDDEVKFRLLRAGQEKEVVLKFKPDAPAAAPDSKK